MFSNKLICTSLFLVHWLVLIGGGRAASSAANNSISVDTVATPTAPTADVAAAVSNNGSQTARAAANSSPKTTASSKVGPFNSSLNSTADPALERQANRFNSAINQKDANNSAPTHRAESINGQIGDSTNISSSPLRQTALLAQSTGGAKEAPAIPPSGFESKRNQSVALEPAGSAPETMAKSTNQNNKLMAKKAANNAGALSEQRLIDRKPQSKKGRQDNASLIKDRLVTNERRSEFGNQSVKDGPAPTGRIDEKQSAGPESAKNESLAIDLNSLKKSSTEAPASRRPLQDERSEQTQLTSNHAANRTGNRTNEAAAHVANQTIEPHSNASRPIVLTNNRPSSDQTTTTSLPTEPTDLPKHEQLNRSLAPANGPLLDGIQPLHLSNAEFLIGGTAHPDDQRTWMMPSQMGMYRASLMSCTFLVRH